MWGKAAHDFKRGIDFRFAVVNLTRLPHAKLISLRADPDPFLGPQFRFKFCRRQSFNPMAHCRAGELRMNGRANSGARNLLKTGSQTVGEKAHAFINPARAYPKVKIQSGVEACQERAIARAILHEAVHSIRLVVPGETAQRRPELLPLIASDIKHAISRRRQEPFVRARKISVATNVLQVHWNLSESLSSDNKGEAAVLVCELGQASCRKDHCAG